MRRLLAALLVWGAHSYSTLPRVTPSPLHVPAAGPPCRRSAVRACAPAVAEQQAEVEAPRVLPSGCPSCESVWLDQSKETEAEEQERLTELRASNRSAFIEEIYDYAMRMNDTQRQELALEPDIQVRNFMINSCTPPTQLMESVYNTTMNRVPYEQACYICGPEQAMLMRTLVGLARPRRALDIGSFTGYGSSAIIEALPEGGELTCLEVERDFTRLAASTLRGRNVNFMVGAAMDALRRFEKQGEQFDFIALDADKPMHGEYYNQSLKILRPGGVLIMFGMLLFPTLEDQQAMERLHEILPNDTRISTAQLPVGCGIQLMVKLDGTSAAEPVGADERQSRQRWQLESEITAIDRFVDAMGKQLGGAGSSGPGTEALTSKGLVALAAARRAAEQAAAEMQG